MLPAPASSLASQLPQVSLVFTKFVFAINPWGSWLASDEGQTRHSKNQWDSPAFSPCGNFRVSKIASMLIPSAIPTK